MLAGVLLGLTASVCWAITNVAVQRGARRVGTFRALLWAQVAGLILMAVAAPLLDVRTRPPELADAGWLAVAGAAALVAYVSMFYAFEHGRLTVAVPIMSGWAALAAALSLLMFDERMRAAQLGGAAIVIAGALLVGRHAQAAGGAASGTGQDRPRWVLASVAAAVGFGVLIPAIARLAPVAGS